MTQKAKDVNGPKILFLDIETAPNLVYSWGLYDQNVGINQIKEDGYVLCWAAKWLHEKKVFSDALPNYRRYYKQNARCDRKIAESAWEVMNEADIIVTHNGDSFDIKWMNTLFLLHKLPPLPKHITVDTKKVAKSHFRFKSNKLQNLARRLDLGSKLDTTGFGLWVGCMANDKKSWDKMIRYCEQDVYLLEKLYLTMRPYMKRHPNHALFSDDGRLVCVNCGSDKYVKNGKARTLSGVYQKYICDSCGAQFKGKKSVITTQGRSI